MAGHDHTDGGKHDHTAGANSRQLTIALGLTGAFLVAEIIGGLYFNSLALLSDAAHMFTDAAALGIALLAIKIGQRAADDKRTFGYRRFEILAGAFNAVLLFLVAGYVLYEGIKRIFDPEPVGSIGMLAVASIGLVVNLIAMRVLAAGPIQQILLSSNPNQIACEYGRHLTLVDCRLSHEFRAVCAVEQHVVVFELVFRDLVFVIRIDETAPIKFPVLNIAHTQHWHSSFLLRFGGRTIFNPVT